MSFRDEILLSAMRPSREPVDGKRRQRHSRPSDDGQNHRRIYHSEEELDRQEITGLPAYARGRRWKGGY